MSLPLRHDNDTITADWFNSIRDEILSGGSGSVSGGGVWVTVGNPADVVSGAAQYPSIQAAMNALPADSPIKLLPRFFNETILQAKRFYIDGSGYGTVIQGDWTFATGSSGTGIQNVNFKKNVTINPAVINIFIDNCWGTDVDAQSPIIPPLTSNNTPAGYGASANKNNPDAWLAFNFANTAWTEDNGTFAPGDFVRFDFPAVTPLTRYEVQNSIDKQMPISWTLDGSPDGIAWTTLDTRINHDWTTVADGGWSRFTMTTPSTLNRYFRIVINAIQGSVAPVMYTNSNPLGYLAFASSEVLTFEAFKAFDNNVLTRWTSQPTLPCSLGYKFPVAKVVKNYSLMVGVTANQFPSGWVLEGSNNNTTWTQIDLRTGVTGFVDGVFQQFDCSANNTAYLYYRITFTAGSPTISVVEMLLSTNAATLAGLTFFDSGNTPYNLINNSGVPQANFWGIERAEIMAARFDTSLQLTGGGGSGGGYNNMLYFDAPGSWTSPAVVESKGQIIISGATGGGGGGGSAWFGTPGQPGGTATATSALGITINGTAGGASTPGVGNIGVYSNLNQNLNSIGAVQRGSFSKLAGNSIIGQIGNISGATPVTATIYDNINAGISEISLTSNGGIGGVSPNGYNGAPGGSSASSLKSISVLQSTVYPISIGQAGGGGNGANGSPGGPGPGGGPGAGALVPNSYLANRGNSGGAGTTTSPGGGGGGTGVHGYLYLYFN